MSKRAVLEVIALDAEDAVAARSGGADRLELVTDMAADGLTPPARRSRRSVTPSTSPCG